MKNVFYNIDARTDAEFKFVKDNPIYQAFFNGFFDYQTALSYEAGKVTKSSNKATSYKNHLIKLIVFYKQIYGAYPTQLDALTTRATFQTFLELPAFIQFNRQNHNFYSATIRGYLDYLDQLALNQDTDDQDHYQIKLLHQPAKVITHPRNQTTSYDRNPRELLAAKHKAKWQCAYDNKHVTFIAAKDHQNYVEGHHLIPMQYQSQFEYTIDFADNIVPLCPNCHRRIHYAIKQDRNQMIETFYFKRIENIKTHGIHITLDQLEHWYG